ncbi:hypothetical protein LTR36_007217 [Oleoguttula mirabilis]|uniref:Uncharacterized protein n=1 Tax=Oleoguttula mirabilis TaxID=1507867 RepID=A0AAV9JA70_9PEZI|nr:hypothetical protein LTR36_007217 [Oleoguttula mirabilis]
MHETGLWVIPVFLLSVAGIGAACYIFSPASRLWIAGVGQGAKRVCCCCRRAKEETESVVELNLPPPPTPGRSGLRADEQCTPPGSSPGSLGLRPWQLSAFASPPLRAISPNSKPALSRQRDHSACRRPDTRLKVRKTRENLKDASLYPDIPPPCLHVLPDPEDAPAINRKWDVDRQEQPLDLPRTTEHRPLPLCPTPTEPSDATLPSYAPAVSCSMPPPQPIPGRMQRHKSVSRRMLTKVKQGISNRAKAPPAIRPVESETSLLRRISGRRKPSVDVERRTQSFEIARRDVDSIAQDAVDVVLASAYTASRSCTDSTVSTNEVLGDSPSSSLRRRGSATPDMKRRMSSSPNLAGSSPVEQTPRPLIRSLPTLPSSGPTQAHAAIPYVELVVNADRAAVDASAAGDVWVAIEATVRSRPVDLTTSGTFCNNGSMGFPSYSMAQVDDYSSLDQRSSTTLGSITSLRLCFKPADGCRLLDVVGQKALKGLQAEQTCSLFVKVHVSTLSSRSSQGNDGDNASLFAELESIVGTLETDVLHIEARYRHSLLPTDNVITVRQSAKVRRPESESRWSIVGATEDDFAASSNEVHTKLAIHLADHYPPERALRLINRCLGADAQHSEAVRQVRQILLSDIERQHNDDRPADCGPTADKPSFVITDIDTADSSFVSAPASEPFFSTAPCTPLAVPDVRGLPTTTTALTAPPPYIKARSTSLNALSPAAALPSSSSAAAPKALSSLHLPVTTEDSPRDDAQQDAARTLWRHIRHSSLSAEQIAALAGEPLLHRLEGEDEVLRELRRKALANKRSVGAETLRGWKWDGKMGARGQRQRAEAPWL